MLQCYRHTLRVYNNYCFPIVTMVTRKRMSVNLYLHCLLFSFNRNVQCGFGSHPTPYSMSTSRSFPGLKWTEREGEKSSPLTMEVKNEWNFITTSVYAFMEYTRTVFPSLHNRWIEMRRRIIWQRDTKVLGEKFCLHLYGLCENSVFHMSPIFRIVNLRCLVLCTRTADVVY